MDELTKALAVALQGVANYRETRDRLVAAGVVTYADGSVMTNADLLALFRTDAERMRKHADELLAKYATPPDGELPPAA